MIKLNLAIIGQGRSWRDIHGAYYLSESNEFYNVKYVVEACDQRREESKERYKGCEVLTSYTELFDKSDIDLVVNATYSEMHYSITKDLLNHGFNVLVEKPFTRNRFEANDLIKTANDKGLVLAVFQQTFYAPYYVKAKENIKSGILGKIEQISIRFNGLARRWDWQTLQKKMAGNAYNTGPHPIGMAFGFLDFDESAKLVYSRLDKTPLSSGDAEDYVKMLICGNEGPLCDIEINSTDAYSDYNIKIQGTKGTLKATPAKYMMKYIVDGENEEKKVIEDSLRDENFMPIYCRENLITHTVEEEFKGDAFDVGTSTLYKELYYKITEGRQMYITPEKVKMIVGATEALHAQNPLPRKF